ncbi:hypothetical protein [Cupriavidus basilensis]
MNGSYFRLYGIRRHLLKQKLPEKQKIGDDIKKNPKNRERWQQMGTCELTALEGAVGS